MSGGTKRSSRLAFRRRLLLLRLLLRGPARRDQLIAAARAELGADVYPAAAGEALKHDLNELRGEYGCTISHRDGHYTLDELGDLALLDLPDAGLAGLAFLEGSFPAGTELPEHAHVRELLDRVVLLLPPARREQHSLRRSPLRLAVGISPGRVDPQVLAAARRASEQRRELAFDYLGSFDDRPRRHRVAPYGVTVRMEGHVYLDATLLDVSPRGGETIYSAIDYRLDRIVAGSAQILPTMLPPERYAPPRYALRYTLAPPVARRRDVAAYFPATRISYQDDGSALVEAEVSNLWQTRQILLRYGDACVVHGPPELVDLFRRTAAGLAAIYLADGP